MNIKLYKQELLDALYEPFKNCTKCPLGSLGRTQVIFGSGNPDAHLMLVGEGPGQQEDLQGLPFVGRSGKLLTKTLESIGLERAQVYITNIVKCRPPNNRKPTPLESSTCKKLLLLAQIKIIKPNIICTLGAAALEGLTGRPARITKERGILQDLPHCKLLPTLHPAYILRNPAAFELFAQDLLLAKQYAKEKKKQTRDI